MPDDHYSMKSQPLSLLWARLMDYQTQLLFPSELYYYMQDPDWRHVKTVLDIGTGNGHYLDRLAGFYPNKSYLGIDISSDYIREANARYSGKAKRHQPSIEFMSCNYEDFIGRVDGVIARLCIQHLEDLALYCEKLEHIIEPDGCMIVVESCDENRLFYPEVPSIHRFFQTLRANRRQHGFDRDAGRLLPELGPRFGLVPQRSDVVTATSEFPGFKELFHSSYETVSRIAESQFGLDFDFDDLRRELTEWYAHPRSYTHLSVNMTTYKSIGGRDD